MDESLDKSSLDDDTTLLSLIQKASQGDDAAISELLNHPTVVKRIKDISSIILRRYGSAGLSMDRDDLMQELNLKILSRMRNMKGLSSAESFYAWYHALARNTYLNALRHRRVEKAFEEKVIKESDQREPSIDEPQFHETSKKEALDKLNLEQRMYLDMWLEGISPKEIAQTLNAPISSVYRMHKEIIKLMMSEIDQITTRMKESQKEIDQEKELTRVIIKELVA